LKGSKKLRNETEEEGQKIMKAVVLASGGLDSTVTAAVAKEDGYALYFLTIDYGQRHGREVGQARVVAEALNAAGQLVIKLDLRAIGGSALTADYDVPKERSGVERQGGIPITYVPARNTIFLSLALAYAETLEASRIYFGANVLDYSGYPDCRPAYLRAFEEVARLGTRAGATGHTIEIRAPLLLMSKAEIIRLGTSLGVPFHVTHSCYDPIEGNACGRCDSCRIRREGFQVAGLVDPVPYSRVQP
jgi:7-cyano-7-deazaguanine synthase